MKNVAPIGFNFWSKEETKTLSLEKYENVEKAITSNGGVVYYK